MNLLAADLDEVLDHAETDLRSLQGAHVFLTGGTGFVGSWLVESLVWANRRLGLSLSVTLLSRSPDRYRQSHPHLANDPAVNLVEGDVRSFSASVGKVDAVVNAATPASASLNNERPDEMVSIIVDGMRNMLDWASEQRVDRMLFTSSGAVYGRQPPEMDRLDEGYLGGPDPLDPLAAYHEGKRLAELLGAIATVQERVPVVVARLFAFVGPYLPIDLHFAIGNFIRDALAGGPIVVGGDGTPWRSYLYGTDLAVWLLAVLARGAPGRAYNVGSEKAVQIVDVAQAVARSASPPLAVVIRREPTPGALAERYVPGTLRIREELGVRQHVGLDEAVRRTIAWHRSRSLKEVSA